MGSISQIIQNTLPYTVGDGKPAYRTNPNTGMRYSFSELLQKANETTKEYDIKPNPYIAKEKPAIYA